MSLCTAGVYLSVILTLNIPVKILRQLYCFKLNIRRVAVTNVMFEVDVCHVVILLIWPDYRAPLYNFESI